MPCYGPDGPPNIRSDRAEAELARVRKQMNIATRAACEALRYLEESEGINRKALSDEVLDWWYDHKKLDRSREKKRRK